MRSTSSPPRRRRIVFLVGALAFAACARGQPDLEELKPMLDKFHQSIRWKDFRGAANYLVPELRGDFVSARRDAKDDKNLFITDFQLQDAQMTSATTATAQSRISWYRLPSVTESTEAIETTVSWRTDRWMVESQNLGPFPELHPQPKQESAAKQEKGTLVP